METREKILSEAFTLFLKRGYKNVTLNEISAKAGVTKGGFYHYFKSKDELYIEVIKKYLFVFFDMFKGRMDSVKSVKEMINAVLSYSKDFFFGMIALDEEREPFGYFNLIFQEMERFDFLSEQFSKFYEESVNLIAEILERGKKSGEVRKDLDTYASAFEIIALIEGAFFLWILNRNLGSEQLLAKILDNYWRSIAS